jgi:hypothetical protein
VKTISKNFLTVKAIVKAIMKEGRQGKTVKLISVFVGVIIILKDYPQKNSHSPRAIVV